MNGFRRLVVRALKLRPVFGPESVLLLYPSGESHEVILVPDTLDVKAKDLCEMVKQANQSVVEPKDVLTDTVFHYDRDEKKFELAMPQAEKGSMVAESGRC